MDEPAPGGMSVSKASYDYIRPTWDRIGSLVIGRHLFDMTNGWEGRPPAGDHVIVVSHRPKPDGWHPEATYHSVDDVTQAIAKAKELAGERTVAVAAGDVGGQALALGLVDEVRWTSCRWCSGRVSGTSGPLTASTTSRTPTWSFAATGCCTCATGCAADGPRLA